MKHYSLRPETYEAIIQREQTASLPHSTQFTLEGFAAHILSRYQAAQTLLTTGVDRMIAKGERLCFEYENQLTLLAQFADEEA